MRAEVESHWLQPVSSMEIRNCHIIQRSYGLTANLVPRRVASLLLVAYHVRMDQRLTVYQKERENFVS